MAGLTLMALGLTLMVLGLTLELCEGESGAGVSLFAHQPRQLSPQSESHSGAHLGKLARRCCIIMKSDKVLQLTEATGVAEKCAECVV
jgi:hypothetical protein